MHRMPQAPDLHLTEPLASKLCLATEGLLRDQAIGTRGTGVHFVINKMIELEHIHVANCDLSIKCFSCAPIVKRRLPAFATLGQRQHRADFGLFGTIEHRCWHTFGQIEAKFNPVVRR